MSKSVQCAGAPRRYRRATLALLTLVLGALYALAGCGGGETESKSMEQIHAHLGTTDREMLWLEDFDHAVVRDPQREVVFAAVAAFIERVTKT